MKTDLFSVYEENGQIFLTTGPEATEILGDQAGWHEELCYRLLSTYANVLIDHDATGDKVLEMQPYFDVNVKYNKEFDQPSAVIYTTDTFDSMYGLDTDSEQSEMIVPMLGDLRSDVTDAINVFHMNASDIMKNDYKEPIRKLFALHVSGNSETGPIVVKADGDGVLKQMDEMDEEGKKHYSMITDIFMQKFSDLVGEYMYNLQPEEE